MKILIFSTYFLPVVGGVQTCVMLLAKGLAETGARENHGERLEVTVATATPAAGMDDSNFPFRIVRRPGWNHLRKLIRESDVVHIAGPSLLPMALAWLASKPFFVEHHVYQAICPNGLLFLQPEKSPCPGYFSQRHYRRCMECRATEVGAPSGLRSVMLGFPRLWLCKRAAGNIAVSNHVKARVSLPRTQTIYHGIESAPVVPLEGTVQSPMVTRSQPLQLAFVGRFVAEKGIPVLLRAAKLLKDKQADFHLTLIGDGPERPYLENLVLDLQIQGLATFGGALRGPDLQAAVRDVSVVVMPSIWEETAGLSAIEHMMRGGVVIAADIGGLGEIVGDAALKFPPGDATALASCIQKLIDQPSLTSSMGAAARARAQQLFPVKSMIDAHLALYRDSLAR